MKSLVFILFNIFCIGLQSQSQSTGYVLMLADGSIQLPANSISISQINTLQTSLDAKANLASPTFTGNVVLGTPASGNFSTGTFTWPTFNQSTTGSAATLTTPRNINGTAFNGSADITITAAAGTLTGTTLNSSVVTSSLTSVGTIATGIWNGTTIAIANGGTGQTTASAARVALLPSIVGNANKYLRVNAGATDYELVTLAGGGDLLSTNNLSDVANAGTSRTNLGLAIGTNVQAFDADLTTLGGLTATTDNFIVSVASAWASRTPAQVKTTLALDNVTNESKATMFTSPTFTGTPVLPSAITVGGNTITFPAVTATLLPNTTTSGVAATATASSTTTVTHNLGRAPTTIRIKSISSFTSNAAATPVPFSEGTWNSTGNRCLYMVINGTTTQVSQTSTVFSVIMVTSAGNQITGVIGNVTSTTFDIVWTETGTHTAGNYLWEAQ